MTKIIARGGTTYTIENDTEQGCSYATLSLHKIEHTIQIDDNTTIDITNNGTIIGIEKIDGTIDIPTLIKILQHIQIKK